MKVIMQVSCTPITRSVSLSHFIGASFSEPHSSHLTGAFSLGRYTGIPVCPLECVHPLLNSECMSIFHSMSALTNRLTGGFSLGRYTVYP